MHMLCTCICVHIKKYMFMAVFLSGAFTQKDATHPRNEQLPLCCCFCYHCAAAASSKSSDTTPENKDSTKKGDTRASPTQENLVRPRPKGVPLVVRRDPADGELGGRPEPYGCE